MRELRDTERDNVAFLTRFGVDFALLEATATGLKKGIFDSTEDIRRFFSKQKIHDYSVQKQGTENKVYIEASFLASTGIFTPARASLYRPETKSGDPRIWFSRLKNHVTPNCIIAIFWIDHQLWLLDLDASTLHKQIERNESFAELFGPLIQPKNQVFSELLELLTDIHKEGYVPTYKTGDTAIGHLIETRLGIKQNSSRLPDYKGVEIKSTRAKSARSLTLFAKVADWSVSPLKSSGEILDRFGYYRGPETFKLYCTVSSKKPNSQGLYFEVEENKGFLTEKSENRNIPVVARWSLDGLRNSLAEKHADTFWIKADSRIENGQEFVRLNTVVQTSRPILQQLSPMLGLGHITMDHLIKRVNNKTKEKGPLFKIRDSSFNDLFPEPIIHTLSDLV